MKKILLHICCGPCAITCVERLRDEGLDVTGFFYNPNIHPGQEYWRRREGAEEVAARMGFPLLFPESPDLQAEQGMDEYFRAVAGKQNNRCLFCYKIRIQKLLWTAAAGDFDLISTSLLYSRYQKHEAIRAIARSLCTDSGPGFYYSDFRSGWSRGITLSKKWGIYRQQYCGCLFSESDRYLKGREPDGGPAGETGC